MKEHIVSTPKEFIFGGKAEFTIKNVSSGNLYKYQVTRCKTKDNVFFVKVKKGHDWEYAGFLDNKTMKYIRGNKGKLDNDTPAIKGLIYAINKGNTPLPRPMTMIHHGKCACCGKKLDDEQSIERGFGPVCFSRLF